METKLGIAVAKAFKELTGKGPTNTKVHITDEIIVIRLMGYLHSGEVMMAKTVQGYYDIKEFRMKRAHSLREIFLQKIEPLIDKKLQNIFYDVDPKRDEGILVFTL